MKRAARPLIGISIGCQPGSPARPECYEECIIEAGGTARFLRPDGAVECESCDGLLIPGGRDLEPGLYGESPMPETVLEERERTRFEFSLLGAIMDKKKPVLGICYGMQLINVFLGGSLFQDIRPTAAGLIDHRTGRHHIQVLSNPYLTEERYEVNSSHHQAVCRRGKGLKTFAYAGDGIIEGVYGKAYGFLVGVQWHPERMKSSLTAELFRRFIDACRKR